VFDTLPGLFIGIGVSLLLLYRSARPHVAAVGKVPGTAEQYGDVARHPENAVPDGVTILRVESGLFCATADGLRIRIREAAAADGIRAVVLDAESVPFIDVTAARMLDEVADELQRGGTGFAIARDVGSVRDVLRRADGAAAPRALPSIAAAVEALDAARETAVR
jgi:SulP family sulfate permease